MKKIISTIALLTMMGVSSANTYAGGGFAPYSGGSEMQIAINSIKDETLKDMITKNLLTLSANTLSENYEYNGSHFYTKKLNVAVKIPEDLAKIAKRTFISFRQGDMMMYDSYGTPSIPQITDEGNRIEVSMGEVLNNELTLQTKDFQKYVNNDYGASFVGAVYMEFEDETTIPVSNSFWLYVQKDNVEGKKSHLSNLYYQQNSYTGYPNMYELLQKVFTRLQKQLGSTAKYISTLEAVAKKVDERLTKIDAIQKAMVEPIKTEDDFGPLVKKYGIEMEKWNLLNDIKYQLGSEIKTKQSQDIIEDLFGPDSLK